MMTLLYLLLGLVTFALLFALTFEVERWERRS
jgi:hypothetical protein